MALAWGGVSAREIDGGWALRDTASPPPRATGRRALRVAADEARRARRRRGGARRHCALGKIAPRSPRWL
jgi:hypothetical protein